MKKKLFCLLLCLLMVVSCLLTSCSSDDDDVTDDPNKTNVTRTPVSLSVYMVTNDNTTAEGVASMQAAFNAYTEVEFSTHVEFTMLTASEYEAKLAEKFKSVSQAPTTSVSNKTETYVDENGQTKIKYPEIQEDQIDIVLITNKNMFYKYGSYWQPLNSAIQNSYPDLLNYYNQDVIDTVKIDRNIMALPINGIYGEYTYMMINKDYVNDTYSSSFDATSFKSFADYAKLAESLNESKKNGNSALANVAILESKFEYPYTVYYSFDGNPTAVGYIKDGTSKNLLSDSGYRTYFDFMWEADTYGYTKKPTDTDFVMKVVKGDYSLRNSEEYKNCWVNVLANPAIKSEDVFSSMLAVTRFSKSFDRSVEIINALTTNAELRNILQYGAEGVHYDVTNTEYVIRGNGGTGTNIYSMNPKYTGNILLLHPCSDIGFSEEKLASYKIQSKDAVRLKNTDWKNWYMSFNVIEDNSEYSTLTDVINTMQENYNELYADLSATTDKDEYNRLIDNFLAKLASGGINNNLYHLMNTIFAQIENLP